MIQKKQLHFQCRKGNKDATIADYQDLAGNTMHKSGNTYSQKIYLRQCNKTSEQRKKKY